MEAAMSPLKYRRVLLKLSGEILAGERGYGIDPKVLASLSREIKEANKSVQLAIVVGGGNIFRGSEGSAQGIDRTSGDYMGMLATVINALALQDSLEKMEVVTRVQTAISMPEVAEPYIRRRAIRHLEKERVVIFAAGTGSPYFSTDTAAALRAAEIEAEIILRGTKVDGIYDSDPMKNPQAKLYKSLKYIDVLKLGLKAMDATAVSLCMDTRISIRVFNATKPGNIKKVILGGI